MNLKLSFLALSLLNSYSIAQSALDPPPGKVYLGAWLDTADSAPGAGDGDRPTKYNDRMGFFSSVFHYAQDIPIGRNSYPFPDEQVRYTGTDALVLMTLYPQTPDNITEADIAQLNEQVRRLMIHERRRIMIRLAPEMNGNWFPWSPTPTRFRNLWRRIVTAVRQGAPGALFVWAPNFGRGYPYGIPLPPVGDPDRELLDTNRNGVLDFQDDPYTPYYPGDEYVDWVGMSVYHFGSAYPWLDNVEAPPSLVSDVLNLANFYQEYGVRRNKPIVIAEGAAAFHTNTPMGPGVGELATKRSFWREYITNPAFYDTFPQVKMISLFEFRKFEGRTDRDFRVSYTDSIREAFLSDLAAVRGRIAFANQTGPIIRNPATELNSGGSGPGTSGPQQRQTSSASKTASTVIPVFLVTLYLLFFA